MPPPPPIIAMIVCAATAIGALLSPSLMRPWPFQPWVRVACRIFGFTLLVFLALALLLSQQEFPWATFWALNTIKTIFLGIAAGMLILFFLSGEALRGIQRSREMKRKTQASSPSDA